MNSGVFRCVLLSSLVIFLLGIPVQAAMVTFNSDVPANNATTRANWLAAAGISAPAYLVDFESGFTAGQNISGLSGLFPAGLIITDTSSAHKVTVVSGPNTIGGSDPVGSFAVKHNEQQYLQLDFSSHPVDYVGFLDIDHTSSTGIVTFFDSETKTFSFENFSFETAGEAEFYGIFRNDMPQIVRVQMDASGDGTWGIDNIEYGPVVPIPGSIVLFSFGLAGVAGIRRRMRRR